MSGVCPGGMFKLRLAMSYPIRFSPFDTLAWDIEDQQNFWGWCLGIASFQLAKNQRKNYFHFCYVGLILFIAHGCDVTSMSLVGSPMALTHSLTHSRTHALTHSHTHSRTHALTHSLTHALIHVFTHSRTHSLTHSRTHTLTHSRTHSLTHSRTHARTHALKPD